MNKDESEVRALIERWAKAVSAEDRKAILAQHSPDFLMFDFPAIVKGLAEQDLGLVVRQSARPDQLRSARTRGDGEHRCRLCIVLGPMRGNLGRPVDFRLTVGLKKSADKWVVIHEHHSIPTMEERFIGPNV